LNRRGEGLNSEHRNTFDGMLVKQKDLTPDDSRLCVGHLYDSRKQAELVTI